MNDPLRYAVYFALPRSSTLWQLAQRWLGRDCESGESLAQPALEGWTPEEIAAVTESPRRYGFHATLKAPFRLAEGVAPRDLCDAIAAFAASRRPFVAPPLEVAAIGRFLALTLSARSAAMDSLAAAAVQALDPLRAALTEEEVQRRLHGGLTPRQEMLLRAWGYPYVLEEFRFHMTLTGPLEAAEQRARLQTQLAGLFGVALAAPVPVREICLYTQDTPSAPFMLTERFPLAGGAGIAESEATAVQGRSRP